MQATQIAASAEVERQQEAANADASTWQGQVRDLEASVQSWQEHCQSLTSQHNQQRELLQTKLHVSPSPLLPPDSTGSLLNLEL